MADKNGKSDSKDKKAADKTHPAVDFSQDIFNLVFLLVLVIFFFLDIALNKQIFFAGDIMNVYTSWQNYNEQALAAGRIPLWSDDFFMGFPLFAESQGALFYPITRLVYAFSSVSHSFSYDVLVHFLMAGCFQYFFARTLKLKPSASLLSAVAFMFSGMFLSLPINFTIFRSLVWIPLVFTFLTYGARQKSLIYPLLTALALVMQMMAGSVPITGITVLAMVPYVFFLMLSPGRDKGDKADLVPFFQFILSLIVAFGLYAFQLLPTLELSPISWRGATGGWEVASGFSFPPVHMVDFFLPTFYGSWADGTMMPVEPAANFFPYIGLAPLLLLLPGMFSKKRGVFILVFLAVIFFMLALGKYGYIYPAIYSTVPFFDKFRAPDRFLFIFVFASSILAGFGLQALQEEFEADKPKLSTVSMAIIGTLLLLVTLFVVGAIWIPGFSTVWDMIVGATVGGFFSHIRGGYIHADYERWVVHLAMISLHALVVVTLFHFAIALFGRKGQTGAMASLIIVIAAADLYFMSVNVPALHTTSKTFFTEPPSTARYMMADGAPNRFYTFRNVDYARSLFDFDEMRANDPRRLDTVWYNGGGSNDINDYIALREGLAPNIAMHWGLTSSTGFASLFLDRYLDLEGASSAQLTPLGQNISLQYLFQGEDGGRFSPFAWSDRTLLCDLMSSNYIVTSAKLLESGHFALRHEGPVNVYRNLKVLPRAWVALPQAVLAENQGTLDRLAGIKIITDPQNPGRDRYRLVDDPIDARSSVILFPLPQNPLISNVPPITSPSARVLPIGGAEGAKKRGGQIQDEQVIIEVSTPQPGYLILADTFYPGWKAEVDGVAVERIYRAYGYFRAIEVPAGEHIVRFYYQPLSFRVGINLSVTTLVAYLIFLFVQVLYFGKTKEKDR